MTNIRKISALMGFKDHPKYRPPMFNHAAVIDPGPPPPAPRARSIVGNVVVNLDAGLKSFTNQRAILEAEITAKTETLRQVNEAIRALEVGLGQLSADPALTEDEREAACAPVDRATADLVGMEMGTVIGANFSHDQEPTAEMYEAIRKEIDREANG